MQREWQRRGYVVCTQHGSYLCHEREEACALYLHQVTCPFRVGWGLSWRCSSVILQVSSGSIPREWVGLLWQRTFLALRVSSQSTIEHALSRRICTAFQRPLRGLVRSSQASQGPYLENRSQGIVGG